MLRKWKKKSISGLRSFKRIIFKYDIFICNIITQTMVLTDYNFMIIMTIVLNKNNPEDKCSIQSNLEIFCIIHMQRLSLFYGKLLLWDYFSPIHKIDIKELFSKATLQTRVAKKLFFTLVFFFGLIALCFFKYRYIYAYSTF